MECGMCVKDTLSWQNNVIALRFLPTPLNQRAGVLEERHPRRWEDRAGPSAARFRWRPPPVGELAATPTNQGDVDGALPSESPRGVANRFCALGGKSKYPCQDTAPAGSGGWRTTVLTSNYGRRFPARRPRQAAERPSASVSVHSLSEARMA